MTKRWGKTKTGKYFCESNKGRELFYIYKTSEEYEKYKKKYENLIKPKVDLLFFLEGERMRNVFKKQLEKVLYNIEPGYSVDWLVPQTRINRSSLIRIINGKILPSLPNFFKLLYFIEQKMKNFNLWFLVDEQAPITIFDDYTPLVYYENIKK